MRRSLYLVPLLLSGCTLFQPEPVIENRFTRYEKPNLPEDNLILLGVTSAKAAVKDNDDDGIPITQLSDRGQAALITETKGKPPAKLSSDKKDGDSSVTVVSTVTRHLVASIRPKDFLDPGDRIDAVRIALQVDPADTQWQITGWSQAATSQQVIDIGKLTDTSNSKVSASTGFDVAKFLPDASVSAEASRERAREVAIKDTTDLDAGVDQTGVAWLDETAGWRANLAHNISIDVTVTAQPGTLKEIALRTPTQLWGEKPMVGLAEPVEPLKVALTPSSRFVPNEDTRPICGTATLSYRLRRILEPAGSATFSESDDAVAFVHGKAASIRFFLAPAPLVPIYSITSGNDVLSFKDGAGNVSGIHFATLDKAIGFRDWILRALPKGGKIGNGEVGFNTGLGGLRAIAPSDLRAMMAGVANQGSLDEARRNDAAGCR